MITGINSSSLCIKGIKIWVLTGDKKETAVNISESCKHFSKHMSKLFLTELDEPALISTRIQTHEKMLALCTALNMNCQ